MIFRVQATEEGRDFSHTYLLVLYSYDFPRPAHYARLIGIRDEFHRRRENESAGINFSARSALWSARD